MNETLYFLGGIGAGVLFSWITAKVVFRLGLVSQV